MCNDYFHGFIYPGLDRHISVSLFNKESASRSLYFSVLRFSLYALIKIYHFKDMINCLPLGFMIGTDQQLCDQPHQHRLKT